MNKQKKILFVVGAIAVLAFTVTISIRFFDVRGKTAQRAESAKLIVYTHSSFMDAYGPGAAIKEEFEKTCVCTVEYVDAGGASEVVERIRLNPGRRVDVILGLDYLQLKYVAESIRLQKLTPPNIEFVPEIKDKIFQRFIPYDWSPMGFIYRQGEITPVGSWQELTQKLPKKSVSLQDPTLSSPGLVWLFGLFSTQKTDWQKELINWQLLVHSYSPSWSSAYGLFRRGQAKLAFSHLTSLVYHWQEEKNESYQFMTFSEGQPLQVDYAAVPETCWNCNVAKKFVNFLTSEWAQSQLMQKNFMFPVNSAVTLSETFLRLPQVKVLSTNEAEEFANRREEILQFWKANR